MSRQALLCCAVMLLCSTAYGSDAATQPTEPQKVELSTESEAYQIGLLLRCPVCQGMPIADSPADMAQAMMKKIRTMTAEGEDRQAILDYFVSRYGEWVLLEPKQEGLNWIIWIVPPVVLLLGLLWALSRSSRAGSTEPTKSAPRSEAKVHAQVPVQTPDQVLRSMIRESVEGDDA